MLGVRARSDFSKSVYLNPHRIYWMSSVVCVMQRFFLSKIVERSETERTQLSRILSVKAPLVLNYPTNLGPGDLKKRLSLCRWHRTFSYQALAPI